MGLLLWVGQSIQVELDKYHKVNTYTYLAGLQHYNIKIAANKVLHNLSDAKSPTNRCEGLIAGPAEWHKKKVMGCQRRNCFMDVMNTTN